MNTYDWLSKLELDDPSLFGMMEVSFKKGARKDFFLINPKVDAITGDMVVVEAQNGYDVGRITLSGELVRLQMKKKRVHADKIHYKVIRLTNERDLEKLDEARSDEKSMLVKARVIARSLDMDMKIGDVEYQGDGRKATFYYTAEGRVDFRELVRYYANEFRIKIEMRQIGSRQESARIGGLGPCGRELCCSTWLSDFKSVSTTAARYQNLAINQTKLSGQCGRLKCCLNYELDSYMSELKTFPKRADRLKTKDHRYDLIKTDIFKGLMYYAQRKEYGRGPIISVHKDRVREIIQLNNNDQYPDELEGIDYAALAHEEQSHEYEELTGFIELPEVKKKRRNNRRKNRNKPQARDKSGKPNKRSNHPPNRKKRGGRSPQKPNPPTNPTE